MMLDDLYHRAWRSGPNMGEHCPTLRLLAMECEAVTEFGTNGAVSTTAFLAGQPGRLTTIDLVPSPEAEKLKPFAGRTRFEIIQGDSLTMNIAHTDLLLIDSKHTFAQLSAELERHAEKVLRWIVLHDTVTFGSDGEDHGRGLLPAVREFLASHSDWRIVAEYRNSHGLMILRRLTA